MTRAWIARSSGPAVLLVALSLGPPTPAVAQEVAGIADPVEDGHVVVDYPYAGLPLLSGFHLQLLPRQRCFLGLFCRAREVDGRLKQIQVSPRNVGQGQIAFTFGDDGGSDAYLYSARHHSWGGRSRETHHAYGFCHIDTAPVRPCRLPIEAPATGGVHDRVFVLVGFSINHYIRDDGIWKIGVRRDGDAVAVDFGEASEPAKAYHAYYPHVLYAWVPRIELRAVGTSGGTVTNGTGVVVPDDIPGGDVVLRGFHVEFTGRRERNLNRVGILAPGAHVAERSVSFADKSHDEDFAWQVDWAILNARLRPPDLIYRDVDLAR